MIDPVSFPIEWFASKLPLNIDQAKLGTLCVLAYPLGIIFSKLNGANTRYWYGLILGVIYQWIIYKESILHTFIPATLTYILVMTTGRNCVKPVVILTAIYCSGYHIYRMTSNPGVWRINISFALMMFICKFTAFAFSYKDGGKPAEQLSEDQEYRKIEKIPSVLQYYSYIYFFPSALLGPFFDFNDYKNLVNKEGPYKELPYSTARLYGLQSLAFGLISIGIEMGVMKFANVPFTLSPEFMEKSLVYRLGYIMFLGYGLRFRYYAGFYMAQIGVDATGLSYTGVEKGRQVFDRVMACHRFTELTSNARTAFERWNQSTQVWLRRNVFTRVIDYQVSKGKRPDLNQASWITFLIAATWHGFYPSYYLTFFGIYTCVETAKSVYKAKAKFRWIPEPISFLIRYVGCVIPISFLIIGHVHLEVHKTLAYYATVYYVPILWNLATIIFLSVSGWARLPKGSGIEDKSRKTKAEILLEQKISDAKKVK